MAFLIIGKNTLHKLINARVEVVSLYNTVYKKFLGVWSVDIFGFWEKGKIFSKKY